MSAEIIYPTVGMMLCNHPDFDYKKSLLRRVQPLDRRVLRVAAADRLLGCGQTAMRTPAKAIEDIRTIKALGLRGVMMPGDPAVEDYDSAIYDTVWEAASNSACRCRSTS